MMRLIFSPADPGSLSDDSLVVSLPIEIPWRPRGQRYSRIHRRRTTDIAHFAQRVLLVHANWARDSQDS